jgi:DNA-binding XRE family transcriptional regulator
MDSTTRSEYLAALRELSASTRWTNWRYGVLECVVHEGKYPSGHPRADGKMLQVHNEPFSADVRRKCISTMRAWVVRNVSEVPCSRVRPVVAHMHMAPDASPATRAAVAEVVQLAHSYRSQGKPAAQATLATMDTTTIGRLVKAKRIETGISYRKLAEQAGTTPRTIMQIEQAAINYGIQTLSDVCQVLGLEVTVVPRRDVTER